MTKKRTLQKIKQICQHKRLSTMIAYMLVWQMVIYGIRAHTIISCLEYIALHKEF